MYMSWADLYNGEIPLTELRHVMSSLPQLMCIVYHVTLVEASRNVNLGTRYDNRCVEINTSVKARLISSARTAVLCTCVFIVSC